MLGSLKPTDAHRHAQKQTQMGPNKKKLIPVNFKLYEFAKNLSNFPRPGRCRKLGWVNADHVRSQQTAQKMRDVTGF